MLYCVAGRGKFSTLGAIRVLGKWDVASISANEEHRDDA